MSDELSIIMYHYVRDLRHSRYPQIKGLDKDDFCEQIRYIKKHYNVISGEELMHATIEGESLPPRSLLLSFDDGYMDHFTEVFPILDNEKLPGCFFPPARCITRHEVLDVNKIHFILASVTNTDKLVEYICERIDNSQSQFNLPPSSQYWNQLARPSRYDSANVIFCKRALQRELPLKLRQAITDELFQSYVSSDEEAFSRELYMNIEQISLLQRHGMYIGSHGYDHFWLNTLSEKQQSSEIDQSLSFLKSIGTATDRWIMCYPYGAYNESLLLTLKKNNCVIGLTTEVGMASLHVHDPLTLPRLDTNDLPKDSSADATENIWTRKALA